MSIITGDLEGQPVGRSVVAASAAHLPWLDWLRFLSAFEVVLYHLRPFVFAPYAELGHAASSRLVTIWFGLTSLGPQAVLVFFVLSGYLVGGNLIARVRARTFRSRDYAIDRVARLMVPLLPAVIFCVVVATLRHEPVGARTVVGNILCLQGVLAVPISAPYWSLSYEAWFYVLGGALAALAVASGGRRPAFAALTLSFAVFCVLDFSLLCCWILGALVSQRPAARFHPALAALGLAFVIAGAAATSEQLAGWRVGLIGADPAQLALHLGRLAFGVGTALVVREMVSARPKSTVGRRIERFGVAPAAFSYTLYLVHRPALDLFAYLGAATGHGLDGRGLTQYAAEIAGCLAVALLFYWLFERRTGAVRRLLKRLTSRNSNRPSAGTGVPLFQTGLGTQS